MKIFIFIKSSPASGGLEVQNKILVEGLRGRGHQVEVVETRSPFGDPSRRIRECGGIISQSAAGTRFLLSREGRQPPVVVIQHGTLWGSLKTGMRTEGFSLRLIPYAVKAYILDQLRLRRCEAIIAVSEKVRRSLVREYFLPEDKINVVYNGVDVKKFKIQNSKFKVGAKTVLYLGRLAKEKGLQTMLAAVSNLKPQIPNLRLLIVGDGPRYDDIYQCSRKLGLSDVVEFVGKVPYEETPKYYQQADVFVLPSIADEGLPMVVLEAMAAGLPVVASNIGGIPEAVIEGETGLLVKPGSVEDLSSSLSRLLVEEELRSRMGKKAKEVAEEKFSQEKMVLETLKVLEAAAR